MTTDLQELRQRFAEQRERVDASTRLPVLTFFGFSVIWLVAGSLAGLLAAVQMSWPELLPWPASLTFGRVRPAHLNMVAYGWGSNAGIGVLLWLVARLTRAELALPRLLALAALVWNLAIARGFHLIMTGRSMSVEWLEFPPTVAPFLGFALGLVTLSTVMTFLRRNESHIYVTLWYCLGAVLWMPLIYLGAQMMIFVLPAVGVVQASSNWWFAHNFLGLWLTPIGVGAAYYIIPKVIGRPIYSYYLSILGFWALALFYSWAGIHHLIGGPVPAWLVTASVVGSLMMFVPVVAVAVNQHMTMVGHFHMLKYSPSLRFVVFGAITYTLVSLQGSLEALRDYNRVTHFTHYTVGHAHLGVYGFFSMVMFGCMYYITPRLTHREWASPFLIRAHFWLTAIGIMVYYVSTTVGGWFQGVAMNDPSVSHIETVVGTKPYLVERALGGSLMVLGHLIFALLVLLNYCGVGRRRV